MNPCVLCPLQAPGHQACWALWAAAAAANHLHALEGAVLCQQPGAVRPHHRRYGQRSTSPAHAQRLWQRLWLAAQGCCPAQAPKRHICVYVSSPQHASCAFLLGWCCPAWTSLGSACVQRTHRPCCITLRSCDPMQASTTWHWTAALAPCMDCTTTPTAAPCSSCSCRSTKAPAAAAAAAHPAAAGAAAAALQG